MYAEYNIVQRTNGDIQKKNRITEEVFENITNSALEPEKRVSRVKLELTLCQLGRGAA